jgi:hypothetical protein
VEPKGSLPHTQGPATCPCPKPDRSGPYLPSGFVKIHFNIILLYTPRSKWYLPQVSPPKRGMPLSSPIRATCLCHLIVLDLFTGIIFGEEDRSRHSSLCSLLHSPLRPKYLRHSPCRSTQCFSPFHFTGLLYYFLLQKAQNLTAPMPDLLLTYRLMIMLLQYAPAWLSSP